MISRLRGKVVEVRDLEVFLDVEGVVYEIFMPPYLIPEVQRRQNEPAIEIITYHYHLLEPGRGVPTLIGFLNEIEKEFFLRFISVSGIGPKAAVKALTRPVPVIADGIDRGDIALLKSLKGIGEQRAKEIIAKLQGHVGKYGLIQHREEAPAPAVKVSAAAEEALAVLVQLEYKEAEARRMVAEAAEREPQARTAEEILNAVYRQRAMQPAGN